MVRQHLLIPLALRMDQPLADPSSDLLAEARRGSPAAIELLYDRFAAVVARVAYRITGSLDDADDVVQDVFVGLPEALRGFQGSGTLEGWIHRVATRTALMRVRRDRRGTLLPELPDRRSASTDAIAAKLTLEAVLLRLPETLRLVFVLKEMEGYSHAEIGSLLGIRAGTSEVRLHRAMKRLRELLESSL